MRLFPLYDGPSLMENICSVPNLTLAWRRVRSNIQVARRGTSAGIDAMTLRDFERDWPGQMAQLHDALLHGTYRPLPPRTVTIPKASGGERAIAILAVRDRVALRAVQQVLTPLFEPLLLDCSFGCRAHVGVPEAVAQVGRYAAQGLTWVADADIANYFDMIDQRLLMGMLRQRIADPAVLHLVMLWLQAGTLATAETDALDARTAEHGLIGRGMALMQRTLNSASPPVPPTALDYVDPALQRWDGVSPDGFARGLGAGWTGVPQQTGLEQRLWTAAMVGKPLLEGAKRAWPLVQRIGGRRLMLASAAAAGAVAVGELALRAHDHMRRGTPQGSALSPLLANMYLHPFDLALTSQGLRLVRFMDDFVIMCASEREATQALDLAQRQLAQLRLTLNTDKTHIVSYADGLEFLGQALAPRRSGPRLEAGVQTFEEAQTALRAAARRMKKKVKQ